LNLASHKTAALSPPLYTDAETIASLPKIYRLLAEELIRKGRIVIEEENEAGKGAKPAGAMGNDKIPPGRFQGGIT